MGYNVCAKHVVAVCNGINDCLIRHVGLIKLENTERAIKKDNPEKLVQDEKKNTICVGYHYSQTNKNKGK
jgi:hypothetical protein